MADLFNTREGRVSVRSKFGKSKIVLGILSILCAALYVLASLRVDVLTSDGAYAMRWTDGFRLAIQHGTLLPKWLPNGSGNLGSIAFYYYPPITYYLTAPLSFALEGIISGVRLVYLNGILLDVCSAGSMWVLLSALRQPRRVKWMGSLLYAVMPIRTFVLFTFNGLSAHAAFVWLPLIIAGLTGLTQDDASFQKRTSSFFSPRAGPASS